MSSYKRFAREHAKSGAIAQEEAQLGKAAKTQGLWSNIGSTVGSFALPILLASTGPIGMAAAAGMGAMGGSILGRTGARLGGASLKGGVHTGKEARKLKQQMFADQLTGAATAAVTGGMQGMSEGMKAAKVAQDAAVDEATKKMVAEGTDMAS